MKRPFEGKYPITQEWGKNPADYARFGLKGHNGVDYGTPVGTPILAPHNGKVIEASYDQYGYGTYVKIENDVEGSILAHLSKHLVNPGDYVTEGTQVGISGNTGNSTGPHLHWGYYRMPRDKSNGYSGTTNPWQYLDENKPQPPVDPCVSVKTELEALKKAHAQCSMLTLEVSTLKQEVLILKKERNSLLNDLNVMTEKSEEADRKLEAIHTILT